MGSFLSISQLKEYERAIIHHVSEFSHKDAGGTSPFQKASDSGEELSSREISLRERMFSMGIVPGACVQRMGNCPLKDPVVIGLGGQFISLRKEEADLVKVRISS